MTDYSSSFPLGKVKELQVQLDGKEMTPALENVNVEVALTWSVSEGVFVPVLDLVRIKASSA